MAEGYQRAYQTSRQLPGGADINHAQYDLFEETIPVSRSTHHSTPGYSTIKTTSRQPNRSLDDKFSSHRPYSSISSMTGQLEHDDPNMGAYSSHDHSTIRKNTRHFSSSPKNYTNPTLSQFSTISQYQSPRKLPSLSEDKPRLFSAFQARANEKNKIDRANVTPNTYSLSDTRKKKQDDKLLKEYTSFSFSSTEEERKHNEAIRVRQMRQAGRILQQRLISEHKQSESDKKSLVDSERQQYRQSLQRTTNLHQGFNQHTLNQSRLQQERGLQRLKENEQRQVWNATADQSRVATAQQLRQQKEFEQQQSWKQTILLPVAHEVEQRAFHRTSSSMRNFEKNVQYNEAQTSHSVAMETYQTEKTLSAVRQKQDFIQWRDQNRLERVQKIHFERHSSTYEEND